jgi:predicted nuclease of restriction endonuclease-like (RecB) superfamily
MASRKTKNLSQSLNNFGPVEIRKPHFRHEKSFTNGVCFMSMGVHFNELVALCERTHRDMQFRAARSVDVALVARNWLLGRHVVTYEQNGADRAQYGDRLIERLATSLRIKGVSATNLRKIRQFYCEYPIQQTLSVESNSAALVQSNTEALAATLAKQFPLSWSHYVSLLSLENPAERRFYEIEATQNSWSVRELERQISSSLYERLALSRDKADIAKLAAQGHVVEKAEDVLKNPLVLEFLELEEKSAYSESDLESAIIDKLETFLLELGKGFLFEARQKRFSFENDHFFVDLVFYNRLLRCYVLIDLKRGKLAHQDLGQMQMYVNYFDRHVKTPDELPTIGIVLCHRKNDALVELTLPKDSNIFATKYQLYLPSKDELKAQLEKIEAELEVQR